MKINIGFTGTRKGLTSQQIEMLTSLLKNTFETNFYHGDCIGADEEAHYIALANGANITIAPCDLTHLRAYCRGARKICDPKKPLDRNKDIVDSSNIVIACPDSNIEKQRSGTWATIRYARKMKKYIVIIYPDGSVKEEGNKVTKKSDF